MSHNFSTILKHNTSFLKRIYFHTIYYQKIWLSLSRFAQYCYFFLSHSFHLFQCDSSFICHSFAEYSSLSVSCNRNLRNFATCAGSAIPPSSFNRSKYAAWGSSATRASFACSHKPSVSTTPG